MLETGMLLSMSAATFWGASAFFIKKALEEIDLLIVTFLSTLTGAICITSIWPFVWNPKVFALYDIITFSIAGVINFSVFFICYNYGIKRIGVSRASPLSSSFVIFTTIFAILILKENVTIGITLGVLFLFIGVTLLSVRKLGESLSFSKASIYVLLGSILVSLYPILIRIALSGAAYTFLDGLFFAIWAGTLSNLAFLIILNKSKMVRRLGKTSIHFSVAAGLTSASANFCYYSALSSTPVVIVNPLSSFYPFIAMSLSFLFAKEEITRKSLIGSILIFLGVCIVIIL